jgi:phospholipid-binding lipoprotein MlaA
MRVCAAFIALGLTAGQAAAASTQREDQAPDPFERVNRVLFYIHGAFDFLLIRPAAIGYKRITPRPIRTGLRNAISNIGEPAIAINDAFQGHGKKAGRTLTRFVGNSTFGVGGFFDVATPAGLPHHNNDFGITLARYGAKTGPYLFVPLLGPMTVRDGVGKLIDLGLDPLTYYRFSGSNTLAISRTLVGGLDERAQEDKNIKVVVASSTDVYASIRSYFLQGRQAQITGGKLDIQTLPDFGDPSETPNSKTPAETAPATPLTSPPPLAPIPPAAPAKPSTP